MRNEPCWKFGGPLARSVLKLFKFLAREGGGGRLKSSSRSEYDQGAHCKTALEQVIESVRFYCEVYNFISLDTILKSRQLSNGDFIATFSEKKIVVLARLLEFWCSSTDFVKRCVETQAWNKQIKCTCKRYLYTQTYQLSLFTVRGPLFCGTNSIASQWSLIKNYSRNLTKSCIKILFTVFLIKFHICYTVLLSFSKSPVG